MQLFNFREVGLIAPLKAKKTLFLFFHILWKSRCHILVTLPCNLKKLHSITEILTRKDELWIFSLISIVKKLPQNNFSRQVFHSAPFFFQVFDALCYIVAVDGRLD